MAKLKDIAKRAGVSINTVSCALRNSPRVSKKLKQRIKEIADEIGYTPNAAARALRIKRSKVIGVVVTDVSNPVFGKMVKGVEAAIKQKEYSIIIGNTDEEYSMEENAVLTMISKGVDGVIITPTQHDTSSLELLKRAGIPFVLMGRRFKSYPTSYVVCDDIRGGFITGEFFIKQGHRDIIFINGPKHLESSQEREYGLKTALEQNGLRLKKTFYIMPDIRQGYDLMNSLLGPGYDFTGVFCFDDYTAFGVIKAIKEKGLEVPRDIAVIGYDNTEFAEMLDMGLTSIDFNEYRIGELAAGLMTEILEKNENGAGAEPVETIIKQIILEPRLVIRGSA